MYGREPSLPSWESLREPSEASLDDEDDDEDEEDQIRATPAPGFLKASAASSGAASHATAARRSGSTTTTMHPPALPRLAGGIRPPQKRKESEGRIDEPAVKRAKRDPTLPNRRPGLGGFQSGTLGGSSTATNRTVAVQAHQRRTSSGSANTPNPGLISNTSKNSKPAMPPPSMPPRGIQSQPSTSSSTSAPTTSEAQVREPPQADFRKADIPSSLVPSLFASAAEKKKKAEAVRIAAAASSSAPANSSSSSSTVNPSTTKPQSNQDVSPSKTQGPPEIIDITSSDSDSDLPRPPPSALLRRQQAKAKGKEKAKEAGSIYVSEAAAPHPSSSASASASTASPARYSKTKETARKHINATTRPRPKSKHTIPADAEVIELMDSSDDDKKKKQRKSAPSTSTAVSHQSRVAAPSSKAAAVNVSGKDDDRMDVDPPPPSKLTAATTVPAASKASSQPIARAELSARPTEILKFTPSPPMPVAAVLTPPNNLAQTATAAAGAGSIPSVKPSAPLRFTPPSPTAPTKTTRTTSLQSVQHASGSQTSSALPTASSSIIPAPTKAPAPNPTGPKSAPKLNFSRNPQPSIPLASTPAPPTMSASAPSPAATAPNSPKKHRHSLALKVTGMNKPRQYVPKLPVQKSVTPSSSDVPEPHSSNSSESPSNGSASRSASSGQIDMRDLNTALGLSALHSGWKSSGIGKGKEKELSPSMASGSGTSAKKPVASPATPKAPANQVARNPSDGQKSLEKFAAKAPQRRSSLTGPGASAEAPIDLTSDAEDADLDMSVDPQNEIGCVSSSRSTTDELAIRRSLRHSMSPHVTSASLINSSSPPPDSALEDSPSGITTVLPEAVTSTLKDTRRQSAPTLGEGNKANDSADVATKSMSAIPSLAQPEVAHAQSLPATPALAGVINPTLPLGLDLASANATLVTGTSTTTITTQVSQDSEMNNEEAPQPRRSLSGVEADEVEQALVEELDNISMEETGMSLDSDADDLPDSQTTIKPLRTRRRQIISPGYEEDESTASGPSTSTRSSRRSSRLSKFSSGAGSSPSDSNLFDHGNAAQKSPESSRETSPEASSGDLFTTATLGGFPAFQFATYRKNPKSYPKVYHSADLLTSLHDQMNSLRGPIAAHPDLRDVYEATILQNTADDEPNAPPIAIRNDIDDEPTPPWNFYYTNKMWHGEGVPDPDIKNLKGCDCKGRCNPKSKKCACAVKNQQVHSSGQLNGYDTNGMLQSEGPVFECNSMCGCDEDCYNRVVQQGRKYDIAIQKTLHKGWGIFNGKTPISRFQFIGIYSGEILTDKEAHKRGLYYNAAGITYLFDIDFYWVKERRRSYQSVYVVDAFHAGNFTRFLNHSCDPNCRLYPIFTNEGSDQKPLLAVFSIKEIAPHEEICFNYQGNYPGDEDEAQEPPEQKEKQTNNADDVIYKKCQCGAANCTGDKIFN